MSSLDPKSPSRLQRFISTRSLVKSAVTLFVFVMIAVTAIQLNQQLELTGAMLSFAFLWGTILAIVYRLANPYGWALVLRGLGHQVSATLATRIWLLSESRRWLPGGVWGYASRAVASKEMGVPISMASISMLVELVITLAAAVIVGLVGIVFFWEKLSATVGELFGQIELSAGYAYLGLGGVATLGVIVYSKQNQLKEKVRGLSERISALAVAKFRIQFLFASLAYFVGMACLNGLVNLTLLGAVDHVSTVPVMAMVAATATAWVVGFLAFFSPGGILVREATLAALLLPWLPYEVGFSLAMLSRMSQIGAEVVGMLVVLKPVNEKQGLSQVG